MKSHGHPIAWFFLLLLWLWAIQTDSRISELQKQQAQKPTELTEPFKK